MNYLLTFFFALPLSAAQISYENGRLNAPQGTRIQIVDREDCRPYSLKSPTLRLPKDCAYLAGEMKSDTHSQSFAITRNGEGYGLLLFAATR